jgi:hypothetical protein
LLSKSQLDLLHLFSTVLLLTEQGPEIKRGGGVGEGGTGLALFRATLPLVESTKRSESVLLAEKAWGCLASSPSHWSKITPLHVKNTKLLLSGRQDSPLSPLFLFPSIFLYFAPFFFISFIEEKKKIRVAAP